MTHVRVTQGVLSLEWQKNIQLGQIQDIHGLELLGRPKNIINHTTNAIIGISWNNILFKVLELVVQSLDTPELTLDHLVFWDSSQSNLDWKQTSPNQELILTGVLTVKMDQVDAPQQYVGNYNSKFVNHYFLRVFNIYWTYEPKKVIPEDTQCAFSKILNPNNKLSC